MKSIDKKFIVVGTIIFIALILFILYMPFLFMGPESPLFVIQNHDTTNHSVAIEILNSDNNSLMKETYKLETNSDVFQKRPFLLSLPLSKDEFTFNIAVDDTNMGSYLVEIPHPHTMVDIQLYFEDYTGNITPVSVEVVAVE
ncbi:hypothetical protein V7O61_06735 [Methanolobus sp. WCC1]|jgi:hypothetical protein|uniref:hypothetical protein n=1 Tax=unclassified Methanolobus TaxID=2629569 RepID=UPI00324ACD24